MLSPNKECRELHYCLKNDILLISLTIVIFTVETLYSQSLYASCPTVIFPKNWFLESDRRMASNLETSIHSKHITEVHDVPISVLIRPFASELDEEKVESLMKTLQVSCRSSVVVVFIFLLKFLLNVYFIWFDLLINLFLQEKKIAPGYFT